MYKVYILFISVLCFVVNGLYGQATLPDFTLKNSKGQISVLWLNQYPKKVNGISVQRSYDSTKNFTSIASVFNPQNTINGFTDKNPPFDQMYYRLFIGFDTGVYILTESKKPEINDVIDYTQLIIEINAVYERNIQLYEAKLKAEKEAAQARAAKNPPAKKPSAPAKTVVKEKEEDKEDPLAKEAITYPSKRIFTDRDNNVVIKLHNVKINKYNIKFFDENHKPLFALNSLNDDYIVIEKVNFHSAGWYLFELFRNEELIEENKFFISREEKIKK